MSTLSFLRFSISPLFRCLDDNELCFISLVITRPLCLFLSWTTHFQWLFEKFSDRNI